MSADEQRKLAAIMFTDMVGYSALSQPGGICVSMDIERQIRNALEARFGIRSAAIRASRESLPPSRRNDRNRRAAQRKKDAGKLAPIILMNGESR